MLLAGTLATAMALTCASHASAGTYRVEVCTKTAKDVPISAASPNGSGFTYMDECGKPFGGIRLIAGPSVAGALIWELHAAEDTTLKELEATRTFEPKPWNPLFQWGIGVSNFLDSTQGNIAPPDGSKTYTLDPSATGVLMRLECTKTAPASCSGGAEVDFSEIIATIEDEHFPQFTAITLPDPNKPVHGTVQVPFEAKDEGSGVSGGLLVVDGADQTFFPEPGQNGGKCVEPITFMAPCALHMRETLPLDTTKLSDGTHHLKVAIFDPARNRTESQEMSLVVNNSPVKPPQTKLAKHPRKKTSLRRARFTFSSDQPGSTFQCKLDKGPFKSCHSPFKRKVRPGRHIFQVRAVSSAGEADLTPAKFSWRVS